MLRRNIYKWHRICSLIVAIPIVLWAASGFMHPIMTNIRPKIATQALPPVGVDIQQVHTSLSKALVQNNIDSFYTVHLVHIDTSWFYQVQQSCNSTPVYLSVRNGKLLRKGDWLYAQYIAQLFLEGQPDRQKNVLAVEAEKPRDCCDAAAICVLDPPSGAPVSDVAVITSFDDVYQSVNRLLPVYKVSFERPDHISIYVETTSSRFVFAADDHRVWFSKFFSLVHTWKWIKFMGKGRTLVILFFSGLAFLTTLMGIYLFFITKSKKVKGNSLVKARRRHRFVSIVASLFLLMFSFSGFYHALVRFNKSKTKEVVAQHIFYANNIALDLAAMQTVVEQPIATIGIVQLRDSAYWQVYPINKMVPAVKDLMKDKRTTVTPVFYVNAATNSLLNNGDKAYADYLAATFSGYKEADTAAVALVTAFDGDYNFSDKLLPVWKVSYNSHLHERYYIETLSGRLSKYANDRTGYEAYSFAFLHKHEFLAGLGKSVKDASTMFWAFVQIVAVIIGLLLYFKWRKRNKLV